MRTSRAIVGMVAISLFVASVHSAEKGKKKASKSELADQVFKLTDLILKNHIDPPTRQEMILRGIKSMFRRSGIKAPANLSQRVSAVSKKSELEPLLRKLTSGFKMSNRALAAAFTEGVLATVPGRPYLISAEQVRVNGSLNANQYVGTGIVLRRDKDNGPTIPKVFYNGPAYKAGAKSRDIIVEIDGKNARKMTLQTVIKKLRGEIGSKVTVKVRQPKSNVVRTLKITRNVAFIPTVQGYDQMAPGKWKYTIGEKNKIVYLRINRIGSSTLFEIRKIAARLSKEQLSGVIFDLRFGGGSLHDTILLANALLHKGTIGHIESPKTRTTHKAKPGALFHKVPMVVLVQRNTLGDRTFLTAALQDNRRARVVGEQTLTDSFVRRPVQIPGAEFSIVMPTAILQRGNGQALMARRLSQAELLQARDKKKRLPSGIVPDVNVKLTSKKLVELQRAYAYTTPGLKKPQADPHVEKALELLGS